MRTSAILSDNTAIIAPGDEGLFAGPQFIRVGPQHLQPQNHVPSALKTLAEDHIKFIMNKNLSGLDYNLPNATSETGKTDPKDLFQILESSLTVTTIWQQEFAITLGFSCHGQRGLVAYLWKQSIQIL